jgi:hypothetical protein
MGAVEMGTMRQSGCRCWRLRVLTRSGRDLILPKLGHCDFGLSDDRLSSSIRLIVRDSALSQADDTIEICPIASIILGKFDRSTSAHFCSCIP